VRLGALLLTLAALAAPTLQAQGHPGLAWERVAPLDWQVLPSSYQSEAPPALQSSTGVLEARITEDGTLSLRDGQGIIRLKTGLPGRPLKAWRDGGVPLPAAAGAWAFPVDSPLKKGLGGLQWCASDFRPFLRGLLWVLEDGEGFLTVIHPATARIIHLPLPPGRDFQLRFQTDRLEVAAGDVDRGAPSRWSLPWMGLLPRLAALGPQPDPAKAGTALVPFPKE
jgi:hypothetical protein